MCLVKFRASFKASCSSQTVGVLSEIQGFIQGILFQPNGRCESDTAAVMATVASEVGCGFFLACQDTGRICSFVYQCFEPSQPLGIRSGLKETFIKKNIVERTNEAEIRPEEQRERKRRAVGRIDGMKYS